LFRCNLLGVAQRLLTGLRMPNAELISNISQCTRLLLKQLPKFRTGPLSGLIQKSSRLHVLVPGSSVFMRSSASQSFSRASTRSWSFVEFIRSLASASSRSVSLSPVRYKALDNKPRSTDGPLRRIRSSLVISNATPFRSSIRFRSLMN